MNIDPKNTIFLIDASSFLYRAYYGMRPLHTKSGTPVHAVYSFCRMIKKMIDTFSPSFMVLVWDSKGATVRHEIFTEYKATRQAPPSDLFEQKEKIIEFANLIGLPQVARPGYEADDLMFSLAKDFSGDYTVIFVTSDKDMGQALSENILLYDPFKEHVFTKEEFEHEKGIPVSQMPFYFALLGDTSDNIPGVKGIGKKTALDLVTKFPSLKDLYNRLDDVSNARIRELLREQKDNAFLSEKLFLLHYYPLLLKIENLGFDGTTWSKARPLFEELQFSSLLKGLGSTVQEKKQSLEEKIAFLKQYDFRLVTTTEQLKALATEIEIAGECAVDTETDGMNIHDAQLVGISVCAHAGTAYYIPCGHVTNEQQCTLEEIKHYLKPVLENTAIKVYFHSAKFDRHILSRHGIEVKGMAFDTLVAAALVTKEWQRAGLKFLSEYYFNQQMISYEEVVKDQKLKNFSYVPLHQAVYYAANDAHQTFRLKEVMDKELAAEHMEKLYHDIEFPLIDVLYRMEQEGIYLDEQVLEHLNKRISSDLNNIEQDIAALCGIEKGHINLNSPKQVQELLFEKLKLEPLKKSAKGTGYSTDQSVLLELAKQHPVPRLIALYRELYKLQSTYITALPTYVSKRTGHIHTSYNQISVATGRLSSTDPNLQNIPLGVASEYGAEIRAAFKPKPGHLFISADYSQIELRVLAYLSQDERLVNAFEHDRDIHTETARGLFGSMYEITSAQRQIGKRINFSILYGMTPYGLSKDLGIPFSDAKKYIDAYFAQYPGVQLWMEQVVKETKDKGYVTTFWGRRRYVPAIHEKNRSLYEEARRVAINTQGQGTAAEIMKQGMIALDRLLKIEEPEARIILQIHDELVVTVPKDRAEELQRLIKQTLQDIVQWNVPLKVTTRVGAHWKEISK